MDREKVVKGLEICYCPPAKCEDCPYHDLPDEQSCNDTLCLDALSLLKEQKAAEPIYIENPYTHLPVSYCPKCREPISKFITGNPYRKTKYCHYCGQAVEWNA